VLPAALFQIAKKSIFQFPVEICCLTLNMNLAWKSLGNPFNDGSVWIPDPEAASL
jgi:hypothetical protein